MNHLDTFSGIGGWALAARWMGWKTVAFVEKEKFCQRVLNKNFSGVPIYDDIFTFSAKPFRGRIDILTGSTPCQPFSAAGKREGSNDERHLFPEFLRVVDEARPRWIVIENVYGLLTIESGQVFEDYHASLEGKGYAVQTVCVPASAVNAPHRRDRVWFIANTVSGGRGPQRIIGGMEGIFGKGANNTVPTPQSDSRNSRDGNALNAPNHATVDELSAADARTSGLSRNACGELRSIPQPNGSPQGCEFSRAFTASRIDQWNEPWPEAATRLCTLDDGLPGGLVRPKGWRVNALKAAGNAIVPQIAFEIFKAIQESEL